MKSLINKLTAYLTTRIIIVCVGAFIASVAINGLYIPNSILSGGITGIAILLNSHFGFNISLLILLMNIPIFYVGYKMIHKPFMVFSLFGLFTLSFFITITKNIQLNTHSMLTTILLGGVLSGLGFGLIFRMGASTGGNDIISKVLNRKYSYSISTFNFAFNLLIIGLSATSFGLDKSVETLAAMYVSSITMKFVLEGSNYKRTVLIITEKEEEVAMAINKELARGCTVIEGYGSFTSRRRHLLYAVISVNQVARLKAIVSTIDQTAFINVIESKVVFGNGFLNIRGD